MSKGIIYFIQPAEIVGTNRYKIGCSKNPDLNRCNKGYKKVQDLYVLWNVIIHLN